MNIFEQASMEALRFSSKKGDLTVEQLWSLPLTSVSANVNLDELAKSVNKEIKALSEESFVGVSNNPARRSLELRLDILKHIIAFKLEKAEANRKKIEKSSQRAELLDALRAVKENKIKQMTEEEILQKLADIDAAE
jgi:hypothetical protein